jgi:hypothetical protein
MADNTKKVPNFIEGTLKTPSGIALGGINVLIIDPATKTEIKILRDGKLIKRGFGILLNFEPNRPGNYYAEIWRNGKPWIFSNPVKIR